MVTWSFSSQSHRWTVYVRGATNEDIGVVIKRVMFQLHPSFNNPTRVVEAPPFELSECGWGEFEIAISLFFHNDVCDKPLDLWVVVCFIIVLVNLISYLNYWWWFIRYRYHNLKLYPEAESGPKSTKKPVVMESYNEIVFPEPAESFFARVLNHPAVFVPQLPAGFVLPNPGIVSCFLIFRIFSCQDIHIVIFGIWTSAVSVDSVNEKGGGDTKNHPLSHWFMNFSEADELLNIASARQQVRFFIFVIAVMVPIAKVFAICWPSSLEIVSPISSTTIYGYNQFF